MCLCWLFVRFFFFFQAEDGIRDTSVTGVQTCALPISVPVASRVTNTVTLAKGLKRLHLEYWAAAPGAPRGISLAWGPPRSEERRVGKEWRTGGGAEW